MGGDDLCEADLLTRFNLPWTERYPWEGDERERYTGGRALLCEADLLLRVPLTVVKRHRWGR